VSDTSAPALAESFASPLGSGEGHPRRHPASNLIDGSWVAAATGSTYERRNPAAPNQRIGPIPDSGRPDVEAAAQAAHAAFTGWAQRPGAERAAILDAAARLAHQRAEELARATSRETGKARAEAKRVATTLRYVAADAWLPRGEVYAQSATTGQVYTLRRLLGVVGLITPWNFPVAIPAWKAAPALAAGNTVVLKPSEDAPLNAIHLARCLTDAGLPPGMLNVVIGRGPAAGAALVAQSEVRAVSFTGSVAVGRRVRDEATARGKRTQLEMGGHNPLIVMSDADLDRALAAAYAGAYHGRRGPCSLRRHQSLRLGPHEQGRAAIEFYTELATIYQDI
jgi:acyl-CoA reductase-like NAD-dependent aldehyde dehydrogenase